MSDSLFRKEAMAARGECLSGELILSRPLLSSLLVAFLAVLVVLALLFLASNSYARKVRVEGILVPRSGLVEVPAPASGLLQRLLVEQGQLVEAGTPLFEIRIDHTLGNGEALSEQLLASLRSQQAGLERQLSLQREALHTRELAASEELRLLDASASRLADMRQTEGNLVAVRKAALDRARHLQQRGLLSRADLDTVQAQWLQQTRALEELELQHLQLRSRRHEVYQQQLRTQVQDEQQAVRLAVELDELQQRILRTGAEQQTVVSAPLRARVGHVALAPGMALAARQTVLTLLPADSLLQAELQVPSAAIGFLEAGQEVRLRYDSFPYQKFGVQRARVREVSSNAQPYAEGVAPLPLYRSRAELQQQSIRAYGKDVALRPGMTFIADVVVDERSLLEWLLEPLYSIRGAR
ncbi:MAG TPA: HlyD family efflux transporter periplasmic adaptor subunit [Pseudomonadaceae bacterium]|nr:HlyD family efflux transporter periplasmic adaptor subunit [Pseudomonadaceae bacterium]